MEPQGNTRFVSRAETVVYNQQIPHQPSATRWGPSPGIPQVRTRVHHCKTQNSGLCSKEEKSHDPISQPSRCNTQEGLLSVAQTGDSDLLGGRAHRTANWASFICSMHTGYKVTGYMFAKQSYWYKLLGLLFKFKAILLVQMARAFFKLRRPRASQLSRGLFYWVHIDWPAPGHPMGAGNPTISQKPKPKSWPPAGPGPLPAPAPAAPHNKTFFLSFKNQQEKYQTHEL